MLDKKELFRIYNLKTWKQGKLQILLSITAIAVAAAILTSLKLIIALNNLYISVNAKSISDGDINVKITSSNISDEQLNMLNQLSSQGKIQYTTTYKVLNNFTNDQITNAVEVKFIDNKYSYINKKVGSYDGKLGNHKVLINKAAADRFQLKKGDDISLVLRGVSNNDSNYVVEDIIDSTDVLDESVLGVIILDKSDIDTLPNGNIKKENLATNINISIEKNYKLEDIKSEIERSFSLGASIVTAKEGIQANKNIEEKENEASNFIQIIVVIITGIGISFTIFLLILKRKKDYVLLSIYGMKQEMLIDIILYETFIISIIGVFIGLFLSFIFTGLIENNVLRNMDIYMIVKASIFPAASTVIFIVLQTLIFTILPITISKQIKPNDILRQEAARIDLRKDYSGPVFTMILLITLCYSIYIGSFNNGGMYISIMLILIMSLYGLAMGSIYLIAKIKKVRHNFVLLALRNIQRQKNRFAICSTALMITIIICGIIINLGQSLIPSLIQQMDDDSGYALCVSPNYNEENIINTENVLSKEKLVKEYIKTINTTGIFKSIQEKTIEDFIQDQKYSQETEKPIKSLLKNKINIEALDISKEMINYGTRAGRWFNSDDMNKNYVVLGEDFGYYGIKVNDEIELNIQGKIYKFTVLGICSRSNLRENSLAYIDINTFKDSSIDGRNSNIKYLIQNDTINQKELYLNLTKKLKNSLVENELDKFNELNKYLQQRIYVFVLICFVSIFSAVCLIGNILMIINFERLNEFLILNVLGAKNRDIKKIAIIEGLLIGGISGLLGSLISETFSYFVIAGMISSKYLPNIKSDLIMIAIAVSLTISASLLVINNIKIEKQSDILRSE